MVLLFALLTCLLLPTSEGQQSEQSGDLRLVGTSSSGRLEIYYSGTWGTICDDGFGPTEALVACRQLGFTTYSNYGSVGDLGFAQGFSRIWLDDVNCDFLDTTILGCSHSTIGFHNCDHSEDVAVSCSGSSISTQPSTPSLSVRLVRRDGQTSPSLTAGRVEVFYNGQWGTVCDDLFGASDARVICRQLGFSNYITYGTVGSFGVGFSPASSSTPIWLDNFFCSSLDNSLSDCTITNIGLHNCNHDEDVAVHCLGDGALRLSGGSTAGRLEVYYSDEWGTVCDDLFGQTEADVACRQLGYDSANEYGSVLDLGYSPALSFTETWLDDVQCSSASVVTLSSCRHNSFGNEDCTHSEDVAVSCSTSSSASVSVGAVIGIVIAVLVPCACISICVIVICIAACNSTSTSRSRGNRHVTTTVVGTQQQHQQPKPYPTAQTVAMTTFSQPPAAATYQAPGPQEAPPPYPGVVNTYPIASQPSPYSGYPPIASNQPPYPTAAPYPQPYTGALPTQASAPPPQPYPQASAPPPQIALQQQAPPPGYEMPQYATPQAYPPANIPGQAVYPNEPSAPGTAPYPTDAQQSPAVYPPQ